MSTSTAGQHTVVIKRVFEAPVERVYSAWTDPRKMVKWLSPNERWIQPDIEVDPVVGGKHNITMRHSDGDMFRSVGNYVEIVPNERISFTWTWLDGEMVNEETLVTIEFRAVGSFTELTLTHDRLTGETAGANVTEGWSGILEVLNNHLIDGYTLREAV